MSTEKALSEDLMALDKSALTASLVASCSVAAVMPPSEKAPTTLAGGAGVGAGVGNAVGNAVGAAEMPSVVAVSFTPSELQVLLLVLQ
jgi:hypothetical protein